MPRTERQIYLRHLKTCKSHGKKNPRTFKGCDCPIYARVTILDPDTDEVLFHWKEGSLRKLGIRKFEDADKLVDKWFFQYLSGNRQPQAEEDRLNKTVAEAVDGYLERLAVRLKPKLRPEHRDDPRNHNTYKKYKTLLGKLVTFVGKRELPLCKQMNGDLMFAFQESWKGRELRNPKTGDKVQQPKSDFGKDRDQILLRQFTARCLKDGLILTDPCDNLDSITPNESEARPFTADEVRRLFDSIPEVFPKSADRIRTFLALQRYSGARISAVATAEIDKLDDNGIWLRERKNEKGGPPNYVWCLLPPLVVSMLRNLKSSSTEYWFWTGKSTLKTVVTHWTDEMLKLYRTVGVEGKRGHEWRDTLGADLQGAGAELEHIQAALNHKRKATTEKSYLGWNKRRFSELDEYKRKMWGMTSNEEDVKGSINKEHIVERLRELERMLKEGTLSKKEFQSLKRHIMPPS